MESWNHICNYQKYKITPYVIFICIVFFCGVNGSTKTIKFF